MHAAYSWHLYFRSLTCRHSHKYVRSLEEVFGNIENVSHQLFLVSQKTYPANCSFMYGKHVISPLNQGRILTVAEGSFLLTSLPPSSTLPGIHSAMQHDNIMSSVNPDYVLIESEAKKVAQSASKALRDSRRRCRTSRLGVPTWTGQHGSAGVPKPR